MSQKDIIGRETRIDIDSNIQGVPAKIDTGADGSAIWASDIRIDKQNRLCFKLFGEGSPFYTGRTLRRTDYSVASVKSASGDENIKFRTHISIVIKGRRIKALFGLCDRSTHTYPVLIGRRTLSGKFIVDVSQNEGIYSKLKKTKTKGLSKKLANDPQDFYQNYYLKGTAKWKLQFYRMATRIIPLVA